MFVVIKATNVCVSKVEFVEIGTGCVRLLHKAFQDHDLRGWTDSGPSREKAVPVTTHPPLLLEPVPISPLFIQCGPQGPWSRI